MAKTARVVWRDYETDGLPGSGAHKPGKRDIREWSAYIESMIAGVETGAGGGVVFTQLVHANSHLNYPENQIAWVVDDPTAAKNGIYQKLGASGVGIWSRVANLPYSFARAVNVGAGTANAIKAEFDVPSLTTDALIVFNATAANTATPVTVQFGTDAPLTIKTAAAANPIVGGITAGMMLAGYIDGGNFRLISDLSTAAAQASALASASAAAASATSAATSAASAAAVSGAGAYLRFMDGTSVANQRPLYGTINLAEYTLGDMTADGAFNSVMNTILSAISTWNRPTKIIVPQGRYAPNDTISVPAGIPLTIEFAEGHGSRITATSGLNGKPFFTSSGSIDNLIVKGAWLRGEGYATHGFTFENIIHSEFTESHIEGTTGYAIRANNGYSNRFAWLQLRDNLGGGLDLGGANINNVTLHGVKAFRNGGLGALIGGGWGIVIDGGTSFERNKKGGLLAYAVRGLKWAGGYCERNGEDKYSFTTPNSPENFDGRFDVMLLCDGRQISYSDPSQACLGVDISGVSFTPWGTGTTGNQDGIIFATSLDGLRVANNDIVDPTKSGPMVVTYNDNRNTNCSDAIIEGNTRNDIGFVGLGNTNFAFGGAHNISTRSQRNVHNYASQNFLADWTIASGTTGALVKTNQGQIYGHDIWQITAGNRLFTQTLDLSKYPELNKKYVWFGVPKRIIENNSSLIISCGGSTNHDGTRLEPISLYGEWEIVSVLYPIPDGASSLTLGMKTNAVTDGPWIACPMLAVVGNNAADVLRATQPVVYRTTNAAAPTAGYWEYGKRVLPLVPTGGQPKARICTVSGAPGTWVSEGIL